MCVCVVFSFFLCFMRINVFISPQCEVHVITLVLCCEMSYAVSLVGGPTSREGRLQVYYNDVWGTVCDDGFNDAAARVVCHSLGFGYAYVYIYINLAYFFHCIRLALV